MIATSSRPMAARASSAVSSSNSRASCGARTLHSLPRSACRRWASGMRTSARSASTRTPRSPAPWRVPPRHRDDQQLGGPHGLSVPRIAPRTILSVGPTINDDEVAHRYEAREDDEVVGFIDYVLKYGRLALVHTEVLPAHQGQGISAGLIRFALDDARRRGLRVIASCPHVRAYVERHPETHDIVVGMSPAAVPRD